MRVDEYHPDERGSSQARMLDQALAVGGHDSGKETNAAMR